jgi:16S rRNA (cytidine1402-2'-O)-methyltransferase
MASTRTRKPGAGRDGAVRDRFNAPAIASKSARGRGLFVVATPIGNLGDMTARGIDTLTTVDLIACEDTRVSGVLLARFGVTTPLAPYHDHNADRVRPQLLARLIAGESIALISDAGTPLISDPGYKLVRACIDAGIAVTPVPGASAVMAALAVAGLPTDRFTFVGFLPAKAGARAAELAALAVVPGTVVVFESGNRAADTLSAMHRAFGPRPAALCRELTKLHEEVRRGPLPDLAAGAEADPPRGEVVLVVGGAPPAAAWSDAAVDRELKVALGRSSVRDAVAAVAAASGRKKRDVYERALALAR